MKPAGIIGIILIVVGIIALSYGGFSFKEHKKDVDIGPVQIGHTEEHTVPLPPVLGGLAIAGAGAAASVFATFATAVGASLVFKATKTRKRERSASREVTPSIPFSASTVIDVSGTACSLYSSSESSSSGFAE